MEIRTAIINRTTITIGKHEHLSIWLHLDYGGGGQKFGGYALYLPSSYKDHSIKSMAGHFLFRCMEIAGVTEWDQMAGRAIRAKCYQNNVHAIGNIIRDDWFNPDKDFIGDQE